MKVFPPLYSWSGSHLFSVALDIRQWPCFRAEFGSFSSSPATSHQIRYRVLAVFLHLMSLLSGLTSPPPYASSTSFNRCHSSLALSHHPGWINKKRNRDVCMICISSCNSTLISVQYISQLTFQPVRLWESYLWASAKFTALSRRWHCWWWWQVRKSLSSKDRLYVSIQQIIKLYLHYQRMKYDLIY